MKTTLLTLLIFSATVAVVAAVRSTPHLISDGIHHNVAVSFSSSSFPLTTLRSSSSSSSSTSSNNSTTCKETYGFMPCTSTWEGNLFLILAYGYLMYTAATFLSNGSELLLEILGPGIVGGLFLPVLGALPDALLILVSGLSGSKDTAQSQVSVGMGLLAGSTVMLLTVIWGASVLVGKTDLRGSVAIDETDTKGFNLIASGVSTDIWTSYAARIMTVSMIPFIVVQVPQAIKSTSVRRVAVLIGLILSLLFLGSYCFYQVVQPWIQKRKVAYVKNKKIVSGFLHLLRKQQEKLLTRDGKLDEHAVTRIFHALDQNEDGNLSPTELRAFIMGMGMEELKVGVEDLVSNVMKEFDTGPNPDSQISFDEFKSGLARWVDYLKGLRPRDVALHPESSKYLTDLHEESHKQHELLGYEEDDADEDAVKDPKRTAIKAVLLLVLGTAIAAVFADPLVDAVDNFSTATGIPTFFISFIALPLATNSSEAVSAIIFASRKTRKTASLTFSELYGAVTMNNVLCLSVFLALVYIRGLTWNFSSEVLIILVVCFVMGILGSFRTGFPLWTAIIAFALYPLSLVLVYILDYIFHWS